MVGKNIIITGGSRGLGKDIINYLASEGNNITIIARDLEELKKTSSQIKRNYSKVSTNHYQCDVSDYNQCKRVIDNVQNIDILINCAGILGPVGLFGENSIEDWKKTIEINLIGTANMIHASLPIISKSNRGKIINFSGGGAAYGRKYHTAYGSSKCAIVRLTETLALEYPNMDINAVAPGAHNTDIWNTETFDKRPDKWADKERLLSLIDFLSSSNSDFISGRFIHIMDKWEELSASLPENLFKLRRVEN